MGLSNESEKQQSTACSKNTVGPHKTTLNNKKMLLMLLTNINVKNKRNKLTFFKL